jgi:DNA replication protein DnaC
MNPPQVLLDHHLKMLRLPTMLREYDKVAQQCATEAADYPRFLLRLVELELLDRDRRAVERRIKAARFEVLKTLDTFDFLAIPSLNKQLVLDLARCDYIVCLRQNGVRGPSGSSKLGLCLLLPRMI